MSRFGVGCLLLRCLLALGCGACASIHDAYWAMPVDEQGRVASERKTPSGLVISGQELDEYASRQFGMVEVTFENTSRDWVRIERLDLDFGGPSMNAAVSLPDGPEIEAWYQATLQRNDIRDTNAATALEALMIIGETAALVGSATRQRGLAAAGSVASLGASTALIVRGQDERVQSAERVQPLPSNHLLSLPFVVPPGLFAKRWVLLHTRDTDVPCVVSILLDYDVKDEGRERALLVFRGPYDRSAWQYTVCSPRPAGPTHPW